MAAIQILALTAYPSEHGAATLMESGCAAYLTKPITRELLRAALSHYLPEH